MNSVVGTLGLGLAIRVNIVGKRKQKNSQAGPCHSHNNIHSIDHSLIYPTQYERAVQVERCLNRSDAHIW
jgi:hypothetical protein